MNKLLVKLNYSIKVDNKVPSSVITSHAYLQIDAENDEQNNVNRKSENWLLSINPVELAQQCDNALHQYDDNFRHSRNKLIENHLYAVINECTGLINDIHDVENYIKDIIRSEEEKVCSDCGAAGLVTMRKCRNCGCELSKIKIDASQYVNEESHINPREHFSRITETCENDIKVIVGEPDFVNPNSFQSVSQILHNIGERAGISRYGGEQREWLFIECDRGIDLIIKELIEQTLYCKNCGLSYFSEAAYKAHECNLGQAEPEHEFDWIIPRYLSLAYSTSRKMPVNFHPIKLGHIHWRFC